MDYCIHCHSKMHGPYCAQCGEAAKPSIPTMKSLVSELIETLTNADSRLWQTLFTLLRHPGGLPRLYLTGSRNQFLPPVRLYLVISLIFFMILSIDAFEATSAASESESKLSVAATENPPEIATATDVSCDITYSGPYPEIVLPRLTRACEQFKLDQGALLTERFLNNLPAAMFLLMPLFAGVMLIWYWRPRRLFFEHLVFQVFNHSGLFLMATLFFIVDRLLPESLSAYTAIVFFPLAMTYAFVSLKTYYGQGIMMTLWKFLSLSMVYLMLLIILMTLTGLSAIW